MKRGLCNTRQTFEQIRLMNAFELQATQTEYQLLFQNQGPGAHLYDAVESKDEIVCVGSRAG